MKSTNDVTGLNKVPPAYRKAMASAVKRRAEIEIREIMDQYGFAYSNARQMVYRSRTLDRAYAVHREKKKRTK